MKLLVDGQLFQTGALERGMGTLTIELLRAAERQDSDLEVSILLNDKIPMSEEHTKRLHKMLDGFALDRVSLETPKTGPESRAKSQLESHIAQFGKDVVYLVPALFLFDYFALFPKNCKTVLIFHDLIPLVMWEHLKNVFPGPVYFARFPSIYEADIIMANSYNTKQELVRLLGVPDRNIVVMGGAPETIIPNKTEATKRVRALGIDKPFVLLPTGGGNMNHKNNLRVAEAVYLLRRDLDHDFIVVASSRYEQHEREAMQRYLGDDIVFTGNISTPDMQSLYRCAEVIVAPALAEGLGIPLLNGVSLGTPVAASRIPVYTELSDREDPFYEFDPYDVWEIRDAIFAALARAGFDEKLRTYKKLLNKYTWDNCALHLLDALKKRAENHPVGSKRLNVLMPDPLASQDEGYLPQSLFAVAPKHDYNAHFYIDPSVSPSHYDDRGADYIRYVAATYDIGVYEPDVTDGSTLIFLPRNADFTKLHHLSHFIEDAVVYISGDVSRHVYGALTDSKLIDASTADEEEKVRQMLHDSDLFTVPHPLVSARGIIVEEHIADKVRKLLDVLKVTCPVRVVPDNHNKDLNDFVHQENSVNSMILDFVAEVAHQ